MRKILLIVLTLFFVHHNHVEACDKEGVNKLTDPNWLGYEMRTCKDGKWNGIAQVFFNDGKINIEGNYREDHLNGIFKTYYENGKLASEGNYVNDKPDGLSKNYDKEGNLILETIYIDGKIDKMKEYFKNSVVKSEYIFKDGKPLIKKEYDVKGNLIAELNKQQMLEERNNRIKNSKQ